jgi:hypothetical protein
MTAMTFNPFTYFEELKAAGVSEEQAKVQADTLNKIVDGKLATKNDILSLKRDIKELEYKLTIRLVGMIIVSITVATGILGFLMTWASRGIH